MAPRYSSLFHNLSVPVRPIHSIPEQQFLASLAAGRPLHDLATLRAYVAEDLAVLRETQPDVVVGDLRHSLAVSARLARVPYVSIVSAYWSPYARQRFVVPDVPATRLVGVPLTNAVFQLVRPFAFRSHCRPMNQLHREHGRTPAPGDLRQMYTDADWIVYPDVPSLVPTTGLPVHHAYIGPLVWSPAVETPSWWNTLRPDRPVVYLTLGSSGPVALLAACLEGLAELPVTVIVASVAAEVQRIPDNVHLAAFLPGLAAAQRASVVICNGGSPTSQQALWSGTPVLGLPSNMDQHLNMSYVTAANAGITIRSEQVRAQTVRDAVQRLLQDPTFRSNATRVQQELRGYDAPARFRAVIHEVLSRGHKS